MLLTLLINISQVIDTSDVTTSPYARLTAMWCSVRISHHLRHLLGDDGILTLPTAPGPAPRLNSSDADLDGWRRQLMPLTCAAGLAGLPQVIGFRLKTQPNQTAYRLCPS